MPHHPGIPSIPSQVANEVGISVAEVMELISDALDAPPHSMTPIGGRVLHVAAEKVGLDKIRLLEYLRSCIAKQAEAASNALQADSDKAAMESELKDGNLDVGGILLEENVGGDDDNWEDVDETDS
jgi:hypothetical protein